MLLGPRHACGTEVLTTAVLRSADGTGHRTIAADLGMASRSTPSAARSAAEGVRVQAVQAVQLIIGLDQDPLPRRPGATHLAETLQDLSGAARSATDRRKMPAPL